MSDDYTEKPFAPYKLDIGKLVGAERSFEVTVVPQETIARQKPLTVCAGIAESMFNFAEVIPGSVKAIASECGHEVWIAPSGQMKVAMGCPTICTGCFVNKLAGESRQR